MWHQLRRVRPASVGLGRGIVFLVTLSLWAPATGHAQDIKWVPGPTTAKLGKQASVEVPEGYLFANGPDTKKIMEMSGNAPSDREVGLITSADEDSEWFLIFEYFPVGYISDEDQDEIDAKELLETITQATEESNEYREEKGFDALHVLGWGQEPHYDPKTHNLVWSIVAEDTSKEQSVNHNVRLLGREGYISATLVSDPSTLVAAQEEVEGILPSFSYNSGKRYAEFKQGDKLAGYGLAALVAGGAGAAALKLGLFAKLGQLLVKAWKLVVVAVVAVIGAIKRALASVFGRKSSARI
jgi:uncharacterized membrane-anchored protein